MIIFTILSVWLYVDSDNNTNNLVLLDFIRIDLIHNRNILEGIFVHRFHFHGCRKPSSYYSYLRKRSSFKRLLIIMYIISFVVNSLNYNSVQYTHFRSTCIKRYYSYLINSNILQFCWAKQYGATWSSGKYNLQPR